MMTKVAEARRRGDDEAVYLHFTENRIRRHREIINHYT